MLKRYRRQAYQSDSGSRLFHMQVMSWMEQCAYIAASRLGRGSYMLTASMDSIAFVKPTRVGDIIYITSQV